MPAVKLLAFAALLLMTGAAHALTPKQQAYKELRSLGISKKDAVRIVRDPGVKKNEWGWVCEVDPVVKQYRVKGSGARYKRNALCE
jgi:hypothetical protein